MAIDPFFQQITSFEMVSHQVGNSSLQARLLFDSGLDNAYSQPQTTASMRASIYQGLYFIGNVSDELSRDALQQQVDCSTGNCTYQEFESLAVCSQCADITESLTFDNYTGSDPSWCIASTHRCGKWSLPNGFGTGDLDLDDGSHIVLRTSTNSPLLKLQSSLPILNLSAISSTGAYSQPVAAQECMLHWCVNKYRSKSVNGLLTEEIVSTLSTGEDNSTEPLLAFHPPNSNTSYYLNSTNRHSHLASSPASWEKGYPNGWINGTFYVHKDANSLLTNYLKKLFEGTTSENGVTHRDGVPVDEAVERLFSASFPKGRSLEPANLLDMRPILKALATSMTASVRTTNSLAYPEEGVSYVPGAAMATETFVRVSWGWIALPAALQLATLGFMCYTAISVGREHLRVWKSSALAVLFFGARLGARVDYSRADRWADMKVLAREQSLTLFELGIDCRSRWW